MTESGGFSVGDEVVFKQPVPDGLSGPEENVITLDGKTHIWHRGEVTGFSDGGHATVSWDDDTETEMPIDQIEIPTESQWYQEHVDD